MKSTSKKESKQSPQCICWAAEQGGSWPRYSLTVGFPSPPKALLPTAVRPLNDAGRLKGSANQHKQLKLPDAASSPTAPLGHPTASQLCPAVLEQRPPTAQHSTAQQGSEGLGHKTCGLVPGHTLGIVYQKNSLLKKIKMLKYTWYFNWNLQTPPVLLPLISFHGLPQEMSLASQTIINSGNCAPNTFRLCLLNQSQGINKMSCYTDMSRWPEHSVIPLVFIANTTQETSMDWKTREQFFQLMHTDNRKII